MASVDVSVSSDARALTPQRAWEMASDLQRFDQWLTIFGGWRSPVPDTIAEGTKVSSLIKVKGFRNTIHWTVIGYDEPHRIELAGTGGGGVRISLTMTVRGDSGGPGSDGDPAGKTTFGVAADLSGGLLSGPVGSLVARLLRSDVKRSVENLAALGGG